MKLIQSDAGHLWETYREHLNGERMNDIPLRSEVAWMSVLVTSVQQCVGGPIQCIRQFKKIKCIKITKEEVKLSLFADSLIG